MIRLNFVALLILGFLSLTLSVGNLAYAIDADPLAIDSVRAKATLLYTTDKESDFAQMLQSENVSISKIKDRRITRGFIFEYSLDSLKTTNGELQMKIVTQRSGEPSLEKTKPQVEVQEVTLRDGAFIVIVEVDCLLTGFDKVAGIQLDCPQSVSSHLKDSGAPSSSYSSWVLPFDFSQSEDFSGQMTQF